MNNLIKLYAATLFGILTFAQPSVADVYELRTYTTNEGKLDALNAQTEALRARAARGRAFGRVCGDGGWVALSQTPRHSRNRCSGV